MRPTVIKLGGSLLDIPSLADRLSDVLCGFSMPVLLVGGSGAADLVRDWQPRFGLSDAAAHELAMESLLLTATLLHELLANSRLCAGPEAVQVAWRDRHLPIIEPRLWFQRSPGWFDGPPRLPAGLLPRSWETTSDTLAAAVAVDLGAEALVFLKSIDAPPNKTLAELAASGAVDPLCPVVAKSIPKVQWINLRSDGARSAAWIEAR